MVARGTDAARACPRDLDPNKPSSGGAAGGPATAGRGSAETANGETLPASATQRPSHPRPRLSHRIDGSVRRLRPASALAAAPGLKGPAGACPPPPTAVSGLSTSFRPFSFFSFSFFSFSFFSLSSPSHPISSSPGEKDFFTSIRPIEKLFFGLFLDFSPQLRPALRASPITQNEWNRSLEAPRRRITARRAPTPSWRCLAA